MNNLLLPLQLTIGNYYDVVPLFDLAPDCDLCCPYMSLRLVSIDKRRPSFLDSSDHDWVFLTFGSEVDCSLISAPLSDWAFVHSVNPINY